MIVLRPLPVLWRFATRSGVGVGAQRATLTTSCQRFSQLNSRRTEPSHLPHKELGYPHLWSGLTCRQIIARAPSEFPVWSFPPEYLDRRFTEVRMLAESRFQVKVAKQAFDVLLAHAVVPQKLHEDERKPQRKTVLRMPEGVPMPKWWKNLTAEKDFR
eukprot:CAMPEP_0204388330 /NCGR_PEP_ID=MMETSP0469-20131031/59465_1 /ASSEMBLY_ACC=CAM_ASM_000384 /TAXON_ID=2969 /ORGANISM="Oxyrrhis marina" /LENGTH=157 /DNA_ID=CAMNT_0051381839 /DNA_START=16 /DNA_END=489 /DNA_ORIENTATION=-